ncbi:MAG TPA: ABC transporter permease, partial [Longimicrobiales bacterium]|nr:ABC transporter permease [Longimicrobiales bacterium]
LVRVPGIVSEDASGELSWPDFRDWREAARPFLSLAGYAESEGTFAWEGGAEALTGARVSREYFQVMGVVPVLGRTFTEEEDRTGGPHAVILSNALWTERFGADPDILGRTVPMDGRAVPVVGVMPAGFDAPIPGAAYWEPLQDDALLALVGLPTGSRSLSFISAVGRLAEGVSPAEAQGRLEELVRDIDQEVGKSPDHFSGPVLIPLLDDLLGGVRDTLYLILAAAGLVLLVAAVNVAGLALSRGAARSRELAVRTALGAPRVRLVRQLMTESLLVALLAGLLGTLVAWALQAQVVRLAPPGLPRLDAIGMGGTTLLFAAGVTVASGLFFGLAPSLRSSAAPVAHGLVGGRGSSAGRHALRPQQVLVSVQVAVAVVLLTGAALLGASFARLTGVELGFQAESVTLATVSPDEERYAAPADVDAFYARLLQAVRAIPGVTAASTTYSPPLVGNDFRTRILPEGLEEDPENMFWAGSVVVGDDFFEASGVPLLRGRSFTLADRLGAPLVAVVSEAMARRLWPGQDPLGKRFSFSGGIMGSLDSFDRDYFPRDPFTVVGVAGDVRRASLDVEPQPEYYRPHAQLPWGFQYLLVRTAGPVEDLAGTLRRTVWSMDASVPVRSVRTLTSYVDEAASAHRFRMLLLGGFAALTGLLAMVGLYAVMTLTVARRTREMGIRLALGAARERVVRGVLGSGMRLVAVGGAVGLVVAWYGSSVLASMLYGVAPTDPTTYATVVAVILGVSALACYGPARRAGRVDPVRSLQEE